MIKEFIIALEDKIDSCSKFGVMAIRDYMHGNYATSEKLGSFCGFVT